MEKVLNTESNTQRIRLAIQEFVKDNITNMILEMITTSLLLIFPDVLIHQNGRYCISSDPKPH